eukprot:2451290-Rhodomonas_salina.3
MEQTNENLATDAHAEHAAVYTCSDRSRMRRLGLYIQEMPRPFHACGFFGASFTAREKSDSA